MRTRDDCSVAGKTHKVKARPIKPITDREMLQRVKLEAQKMGPQPYMLILIGLNTGLRISDILPLTVGEFRESDRLMIFEQKTGKFSEIRIPKVVIADVLRATAKKRDDELLFESRCSTKRGQPIDYVTAYRWVKEACRRAGMDRFVGCHTLRKTYGYTMYQRHHDVGQLMEHFNHSSQGVTLKYIGISQKNKDKWADEPV